MYHHENEKKPSLLSGLDNPFPLRPDQNSLPFIPIQLQWDISTLCPQKDWSAGQMTQFHKVITTTYCGWDHSPILNFDTSGLYINTY